MRGWIQSFLDWLAPRVDVAQRLLFRPVIAQLEQQRRETLELERLLLAIARIEGVGDEPADPPDRREP